MKNRLIVGALLVATIVISIGISLLSVQQKLWKDTGNVENGDGQIERQSTKQERREPTSLSMPEPLRERVESDGRNDLDGKDPQTNIERSDSRPNKELSRARPQRTPKNATESESPLALRERITAKPVSESLFARQEPQTENPLIFLDQNTPPVPELRSERGFEEKEKEPVAGDEDNPYERANWFMYQRMYPFDKVPDGARRLAFEEVLSRGEGLGPDAVGTTWAPIGPLPTTSAFPNNGGFTSGRINGIAVSPANNQLILIASATGGIWRSTNGGTTFAPVSDNQADLAVGAIAFAPSNPNIVYAGMGDVDNRYFGTGVLKSTDAGATWTRVNTAGFPDRGNCVAVKVDPNDANKVYVAQYDSVNPATGGTFVSGVYVSTNGGINWTNTLSSLASDLAIHPTNPQIIYAGVRFSFGAGQSPGLYKSTNGGTSWTRVFTSPYTATQNSTREFRVAVTPASPDRVYVYYGTTGTSPAQVRLERSDDAGLTWTNRGVISNNVGGVDPGQFGYNTYLAASPTDANTVYVGSRDVFRSTDSGVAFVDISNSFAAPWPTGNYTPNQQKFHADQQSFAFEPGSGSTFYCGNDGGIWKTTNSGSTFTSLNSTLSLTQFVSIGLHPLDPTRSYGGAQDNGSQRRTGGTGWNEFSGGDGGKLVINPLNPAMVFHSYVLGSITRNTNNGVTYTGEIADAELLGEPATNGRVAFYPPIVGNGVNARLYVGTWRLLRCDNCDDTSRFIDNGGTPPTWIAPAGTFDQTTGGSDVLSALAVARSNNQVIYSGSRGGRAMVSTNGGTSWSDITPGLPVRSIANITVSPTNPALVYLTVSGYGSGHVFRSTNSGANWTDISSNLPNIPTSAFLIDPLTPTTLYAGTDIGVFRTTDNGGSWAAFNNGLPPVPIMEFSAQANGLIQIGTYGRGAYELPTIGGNPTPTPTVAPTPTPTVAPTPTPTPGGTSTTVSFTGPAVTITDNSPTGVNIPVVVGTACTISDLNFRFDGTANANPAATTVGVNHSWVGDLRFRLTSPAGTSVTFFDRPGVPAGGSGCNSNNLAALLIDDDGGFPLVENQCGAGDDAAFPSGTFSPNSPLSAFDGQNALGTWVLNVSDNVAQDSGSVRAFSLIFASCGASPSPTPTPSPAPLVAVSGRVTTPTGLGLRNAVVSLVDPQGVRRTATTSSFGVYNFASIPTGVSYVVSVTSKRYRFSPQTVSVTGTLLNVDFIGLE